MSRNQLGRLGMVLLALLLLVASAATAETAPVGAMRGALRGEALSVENLSLSEESGTLGFGESMQLSLTGDTSGVAQVFWQSGNEGLLRVERMGYVRCVGTNAQDTAVQITAEALTWDGQVITCAGVFTVQGIGTPMSIVDIPPTISLSEVFLREEVFLYPGEEFLIAPTLPAKSRVTGYQSSNPSVASLSQSAVVTAHTPGEATLTLEVEKDGAKQQKSLRVVVLPEYTPVGEGLQLSLSEIILWPGETIKPKYRLPVGAEGGVIFSSDQPQVASVSADGVIKAVDMGETLIHVATKDGSYATAIWVRVPGIETPVDQITLKEGETFDLSVLVKPEDLTNVTLAAVADNTSALSVDNLRVQALSGSAAGDVSVTVLAATRDGLVMRSVQLTIEGSTTTRRSSGGSSSQKTANGLTINPRSATLRVGDKLAIAAVITPSTANQAVTFMSSSSKIATVDSTGLVTAVAPGHVTITVTSLVGGYTATCAIEVTEIQATSIVLSPEVVELFIGQTVTVATTVLPDPLPNEKVTYQSSDPSVAFVGANTNDKVEIRGMDAGKATITATVTPGNKTATVVVTVKRAVTSVVINNNPMPDFLLMEAGEVRLLTASVAPANATNRSVVWKIDPADEKSRVIELDASSGQITAIQPGEVTIAAIAADGSGQYDMMRVKVVPKRVVSIDLPDTVEVIHGTSNKLINLVLRDKNGDPIPGETVTVNYASGNVGIRNENGYPTYWVGYALTTTPVDVTFRSVQNPSVYKTVKVSVVSDVPSAIAIIDLLSFYTAGIQPQTNPWVKLEGANGGIVSEEHYQRVVISSLNTSVATLTKVGDRYQLSPHNAGTATLRASYNYGGISISDEKPILVKWAPITGISIVSNQPQDTVHPGEVITLTATAQGTTGNGKVNPKSGHDIRWEVNEYYFEIVEPAQGDDNLHSTITLRAIRGHESGQSFTLDSVVKAAITTTDGQSATGSITLHVKWWSGEQDIIAWPDSNITMYLDGPAVQFSALWKKFDAPNGSTGQSGDFSWEIDNAVGAAQEDSGVPGLIQGTKVGGIKIRATGVASDGVRYYSDWITVNVQYAPTWYVAIEPVTQIPDPIVPDASKQYRFEATVYPVVGKGTANPAVTWSLETQPAGIATIDQSGNVRFTGVGTVKVIAKSVEDATKTAEKVYTVVEDKPVFVETGVGAGTLYVGKKTAASYTLNIARVSGGTPTGSYVIELENNPWFVLNTVSSTATRLTFTVEAIGSTDGAQKELFINILDGVTREILNSQRIFTGASEWGPVKISLTPSASISLASGGTEKTVTAEWVSLTNDPEIKIDPAAVKPNVWQVSDPVKVSVAGGAGQCAVSAEDGIYEAATATLTANGSYHGQTIAQASIQVVISRQEVHLQASVRPDGIIAGSDVDYGSRAQLTATVQSDSGTPVAATISWAFSPSDVAVLRDSSTGALTVNKMPSGGKIYATPTATLSTGRVVTGTTIEIPVRYDTPKFGAFVNPSRSDAYARVGQAYTLTIPVSGENGGLLDPALRPDWTSWATITGYTFSIPNPADPFTCVATAAVRYVNDVPSYTAMVLNASPSYSHLFTLPPVFNVNEAEYYIQWVLSQMPSVVIGVRPYSMIEAEIVSSTPGLLSAGASITYISETPEIATVSAGGQVIAFTEGTARFVATAQIDGETISTEALSVEIVWDNLVLTVPTELLRLSAIGDMAPLEDMMTAALGGALRPDIALVYASSNEQVATVVDGQVTAVGEGVCIITVSAFDGHNEVVVSRAVQVGEAEESEMFAAFASFGEGASEFPDVEQAAETTDDGATLPAGQGSTDSLSDQVAWPSGSTSGNGGGGDTSQNAGLNWGSSPTSWVNDTSESTTSWPQDTSGGSSSSGGVVWVVSDSIWPGKGW